MSDIVSFITVKGILLSSGNLGQQCRANVGDRNLYITLTRDLLPQQKVY